MPPTYSFIPIDDILEVLEGIVYSEKPTVEKLLKNVESDLKKEIKPVGNLKTLDYFMLHKTKLKSSQELCKKILKECLAFFKYSFDSDVTVNNLLGSIIDSCLQSLSVQNDHDIYLLLLNFIDSQFREYKESKYDTPDDYCHFLPLLITLEKLCDWKVSIRPVENVKQFPDALSAEITNLVLEEQSNLIERTLSSMLPKFIEAQSSNAFLKNIWNLIGLSKNDTIRLEKKLSILCQLENYFITLTPSAFNYPLYDKAAFWDLIQLGLIDGISYNRKQALYLLKKYILVLKESDRSFEVESFFWKSSEEQNAYGDSKLLVFWENMFILFEMFEEKQVHLIMPALKNMSDFYEVCKINERICYSWLFCAFIRIFNHSSTILLKWGLQEFCLLNAQLLFSDKKCNLLLSNFFRCLNNMFFYSTSNNSVECNLENRLEQWFLQITQNEDEFAFETMLKNLADCSWSPIPLFFVTNALSKVSTIIIWNSNCFNYIQKILIETLKTQCVYIRSAIQSRLLRSITLIPVKHIDICTITRILGHFNGQESLRRCSGMWLNCCSWLKELYPEKFVELADLCSKRVFTFNSPTISIHSFARMVVLSYDASSTPQLNDKIKELLNYVFQQFEDCDKRGYACIQTQDKCVEFVKYLIDECDSVSPVHPEDELLAYMKRKMKHLLYYIQFRLKHGPLDFISIKVYKKTAMSIAANRSLFHGVLTELIQLYLEAFNVLKDDNLTFLQEYLSVKIIGFFYYYIHVNDLNEETFIAPFEGDIIEHIFRKRLFDKENIKTCICLSSEPNMRGKMMSSIMKSLWAVFDIYLRTNADHIRAIIDMFEKPLLINTATLGLFEDGKQAVVPIIRSYTLFMPFNDFETNTLFMDKSMIAVSAHRKSELFWVAMGEWIAMIFQEKITSKEEYQNELIEHAKQIFHLGCELIGLVDVFMEQLKKINFTPEYAYIISEGLTFGSVCKKDRRLENEVCQFILNEVKEGKIESFGTWKAIRNDKEVRLKALDLLLNPNNIDKDSVIAAVINDLLQFDAALTKSDTRYFNDSVVHRRKHRILQAILVLETYIAKNSSSEFDVLPRKLFDWALRNLQSTSQQHSVRYQLEWLFVRLCVHYPFILSSFWHHFNEAADERLGSMCSFISIAYHLAVVLQDKIFLRRCFENVIPWCMSQNFNVRLYAQVVLNKLWDLSPEIWTHFDFLKKSQWKCHDQGNMLANSKKMLNDFYFCAFHPMLHFNLQTIYWDLPRLSNISSEEWIQPELLNKYSHLVRISGPQDNSLEAFEAPIWIAKATGGAGEDGEKEISSIQKKYIPWTGMFPEPDELWKPPKTGVIVVASLVNKPANLGGLARTCEIFAARELVLPSLEIIKDRAFGGVSMTAEKHLSITEVKHYHLQEYLKHMKRKGYMVVGAEQTTDSVQLGSFEFPRHCIILLGSEREGIPVNLIPFVDFCVEIPQLGLIRSLNVHVSGALFLWEYSKQHSFELSNDQPQAF